HDPLEQGGSFAGRTPAVAGVVVCKALRIREKCLPADVGGMMALDDDGPFRLRSLDGARPDLALRVHHARGVVATEDVCAGVRGIREQTPHATMRQTAPTNFSRPCPTVGTSRERTPLKT